MTINKNSPLAATLAKQIAASRGHQEAAKFLRSHGYCVKSAALLLLGRRVR